MKRDSLQVSEASVKDGIWLICIDGNNTIKRWGSAFSGKEMVYLNDKLVSEKRSLKGVDKHTFEDGAGTKYQINYKLISLVDCKNSYYFTKNGVVIKQFNLTYNKGNNITVKKMLPVIVAAAIVGTLIGFSLVPKFSFYILIVAVLIYQLYTRDYGSFELEEVEGQDFV